MQNLDLFNEAKQFEIVVDFLHHCKHVFKLKQEHLEAFRVSIAKLPRQMASKFKHI